MIFPKVGAVVRGFEEHAGRTVQLADDHALGAVNDEGAVLRHQRNVAEEYFLFLNIADGASAVSASLSQMVRRIVTLSGAE